MSKSVKKFPKDSLYGTDIESSGTDIESSVRNITIGEALDGSEMYMVEVLCSHIEEWVVQFVTFNKELADKWVKDYNDNCDGSFTYEAVVSKVKYRGK